MKKTYKAWIVGALLAITNMACADWEHHHTHTIEATTSSQDQSINDGIAMAASNNHPFDFATDKSTYQLGFNCSDFKGSTACSVGLAKRVADLLVHGSASATEIRGLLISAGFVLRF